MIKRYKLTESRNGDYINGSGKFVFCSDCLEKFFHGDVSDTITLVLSDKPVANSYKISGWNSIVGKFGVHLSNGKVLHKYLYDVLTDEILNEFNGTAYLAVE